jgi:glycosyltransferase involved in cell wall biosynthesis
LNSIKVSIIIPVYNGGKYVAECIQSILDQTLIEIEIIVVNDGSTDDSVATISRFAAQDKRLVFLDSKNEGVSAARNKGIIIAKGEYIGFTDADDYVAPEMYEILYEKAKEAKAELAICNVLVVSENTANITRLPIANGLVNLNQERVKALAELMHYKYDHANFNKIYATNVIKKYNVLFNTNMKVHEDLLFNLMYFQFAKDAVTIEQKLYYYRLHPTSVMHSATHDVIAEYNLLFNFFNGFCNQHGFVEVRQNFNKEMCHGFYYTIIPKVLNAIHKKRVSLFRKVALFAKELSKINDQIFIFDREEIKGIQGFKKMLLVKKNFYFFSFIVTIKNSYL